MRPIFIWSNGTAVPDPWGPGFSADIARSLTNPWNDVYAQFWGSEFANVFEPRGVWYPAATFPMEPSINALREGVNSQIASVPKGTPIALSGYSQSAIAIGEVWAYDILDPNGIHHDRLDDVLGVVNFGEPIRCPGVANGNLVAGLPVTPPEDGFTSGGIAGPRDLRPEQTPDHYLSCALDGDLYAACPVGDDPWGNEALVGQIETAIYDFVLSGDLLEGIEVIIKRISQMFLAPVDFVWAHFQAIVNGISFAAAGPSAAHWQYGPFVPSLTDWLLART